MKSPRKVLIVEDEETLAENLQVHLQRSGWEARIANSGRSAIEAANDFFPELILLDFHLPDMTGFDVLDAIRAANHCCGCVLMTAHPQEDVLADAQLRRIAPILSKPFSMAGLINHLSGAVKRCSTCLEARGRIAQVS